jgi:hypothetical protein
MLTEHEVKDFCTDNIAHFKTPLLVMFDNDFPIGVTGRIPKIQDAGRFYQDTWASGGIYDRNCMIF